MKKLTALMLILALCLSLCTAFAEEPKEVTVRQWLDAEGKCGPCTLTVTVQEVLNPVLAVVGDDTASVNLFGLYLNGNFFGFADNGFMPGDVIRIADPVYNVFEGTVEMADTKLTGIVTDSSGTPVTSVQEWLVGKGPVGSVLVVMVQEVINPVLASVTDGTASVNLFGVQVDGEFTPLTDLGIQAGELLVLVNPVWNEFEGTVELADSLLYRRFTYFVQE